MVSLSGPPLGFMLALRSEPFCSYLCLRLFAHAAMFDGDVRCWFAYGRVVVVACALRVGSRVLFGSSRVVVCWCRLWLLRVHAKGIVFWALVIASCVRQAGCHQWGNVLLIMRTALMLGASMHNDDSADARCQHAATLPRAAPDAQF